MSGITPNEFLLGRRHLTGDAAWEAFVALGGDAFAANHGGWHRRTCPAHASRSGNSCVFKIVEDTGTPMLIVYDHAGCTEREILEAAGIDIEGLRCAGREPTELWLSRGRQRPKTFPPFVDPATTAPHADRWLTYFAEKRRFDVDVLRQAGVIIVRHRGGERRARFPFTVDGQLVGAWDRAILDVEPGGRRWIMSGSIPVPFGWDSLPAAWASGHVYVVEGPTDAVALMHALPGAVILGAGVGRGMWKPWWGRDLADLAVWVVADNDAGGAMTRRVAHEVLDPYAWQVVDVRVPRQFGDVDDWRLGAGADFRTQFFEAIQRSTWGRAA